MVETSFWNPRYPVSLVVVTPGRESASRAVEQVCVFLQSAGRHPVQVKKDVAGFVGNRL